MRVLQINSVCGIRSTGRICTDIADVLHQGGDECRIAYGRESVPEKYNDIAFRIGTDRHVKLHALASRFFDTAGFHSKQATKSFLKYIDEYSPDVIHLHNIHGYYLDVEILFDYLKKKDIPVVWTLHDCWSYTGHCSHYTSVGCDRWMGGCYSCPQKHEYPASIFIDGSKRNYKRKKEAFCGVKNLTIVTPSDWLAEETRKSFLGEYPVITINNGINTEVFKPTESDFRERYGLEDKKIILGVSTAWSESKGLGDFIKLSKLLDDRFKIVLVGLTDDQIEDVPKEIVSIKRTNNACELAEIYTASDVFVNLTYNDNYPTVNLEAQRCGTPVLTYRTGGSPESVPAENVVEQGNLDAVIKMLDEKLDIKLLDCSRKTMVEKYIEIYKGLL